MSLPAPLSALQDRLQHRFADPLLLVQALTHRSFSTDHNERLEFLGDSVLNLAVAHLLFERLNGLPEGDLSRVRANLVKQDTLHGLALGLDLAGLLRLGEGEMRSGGQRRPSILADALEAVLGAVYLGALGGTIAALRVLAPAGQGAWRITRSAVEPTKNRATRERPLAARTIRSMRCFSASSMIA